ncbi:Wadjet anti-phage system protein JetD domain-containing protein [Blautia sp. Sow4_E7]|uniref:Wadjet anti-phage system protein JetD domain-containing protein n=1 Tax=Blautia sp. Sow4_E7 TaxID=3438749 RepID=UPI003F8DDF0A
MQYDQLLLKNLLDSYEKSLLSSGKNKVRIHVSMTFSRRNLPEYFDESSMVYEQIHVAAEDMERRGFLKIQWKNRKPGTIIENVILKEEAVEEVYQYLHRTPKAVNEELTRAVLREYDQKLNKTEEQTVIRAFLRYILERFQDGKSVKEYIDISEPAQTRELLDTLCAIEQNEKPVYIREFSIDHLGDSKKFENMLGLIGKILRRFGSGYEEMDVYEILSEYQIYHTPNYVYLKGCGCLVQNMQKTDSDRIFLENELDAESHNPCGDGSQNRLQNTSGFQIDLAALQQGIGISGEDINTLALTGISNVKRIITIENLTTFYRWSEPESILIYLGGYHNQVRRRLLQMIYKQLPQAEYFHFGDIDVGGFEIYLDLCRKTNIPFQLYHMGIPELKKYEKYSKKLTENDNKRLDKMLEKLQENPEINSCAQIAEVLKYMKITQLKLEQECQHV